MRLRHPWQRGLLLAVALAPLAYFIAPAANANAVDEPAKLRAQAELFEKAGNWAAAADKYEELLRLDRRQSEVRERYQHCLQRYFQVVRFRDPSYRKEVLALKYPQATRLYELVLHNLLTSSLDKDKVSADVLFRKGLEEFHFALASPEFCSDHLGGLKPDQTRGLRNFLHAQYGGRRTMTFEETLETVREVVMRSTNHFPNINPTTVVMEFLCGACLAMDDYTAYLTPRQLRELCAALKGRHVGVGIRLKSVDNKIVIGDVLLDSPAAEAMPSLNRGDHVVAIDKRPTRDMAPETAMELLDGEEGTIVQVELASSNLGTRIVLLRRRALFLPSVRHDVMSNIGYLKINCFQETTLEEFDQKMAELMNAECKALILDLRGNPGGLLDAAIEIAKRLLPSGVIVSTQHHDARLSAVYHADNPMALSIPVVVLVNGDTASAAEVLAGALKENQRAIIVGETTYGKGSSQGLMKLPSEAELRLPTTLAFGGATGGIRITIARFFSPTGQPYSGRGVVPDVPAEGDAQLYQARDEAERLLGMLPN